MKLKLVMKKKLKNHLKEKVKKAKAAAQSKALEAAKKLKKAKVTVAKGIKVARGVETKMRKKPGSSNAGKYKHVDKKDFAGKAGGASEYSFPIPDLAHARNALARAHFAPDPKALKAKVYKMYPELKKRAAKRKKKEQ